MSDFEVMSIEEAKALREENQRLKDLLEALGGMRVEPKPGEVFDPLWVEDYGKDRD
jgi:hypothetical protein